MKARYDHTPEYFKRISGIIEANLFELSKYYPAYTKDILRVAQVTGTFNANNRKYIVRFEVKKGILLVAEIGYPSDKWHLKKADYYFDPNTIIG